MRATAKLVPILANQAATILIGLAGVRLVSTHIPPSVYGAYALLLTLLPLGNLLTHCSLLNHAARNWQREQAAGSGPAYLDFLWRSSWQRSIVLGVLLIGCGFGLAVSQRPSYCLFAVLALFAGNLAWVFLSLTNFLLISEERHWRVFLINVLGNIARVFIPLLLYVLLAP